MKHKPPPMNNILSLFFYIAIITRNNQRLRQRSKVKTLLLQRSALRRRLHETDSQNTRDQITRGRRSKHAWSNCVLCILVYSFLVEVKANDGLTMATHMRRMRSNNLEIRIAGDNRSPQSICWWSKPVHHLLLSTYSFFDPFFVFLFSCFSLPSLLPNWIYLTTTPRSISLTWHRSHSSWSALDEPVRNRKKQNQNEKQFSSCLLQHFVFKVRFKSAEHASA